MHRDLKPENFLLTTKGAGGELKLTDFGLGVFFRPGERFKDLVGSPYYVAPEVLRKNYSHQADMWSLGVILYILLSGLPPFWGDAEDQIFKMVRFWVMLFDAAGFFVDRGCFLKVGVDGVAFEYTRHIAGAWATWQRVGNLATRPPLLTRQNPKPKPQTPKQVLKGVVDFQSDPWPRISAAAKDCVKRLLTMDPAQRASAEDILKVRRLRLRLRWRWLVGWGWG
jgi:serine/threonine protein kinase